MSSTTTITMLYAYDIFVETHAAMFIVLLCTALGSQVTLTAM